MRSKNIPVCAISQFNRSVGDKDFYSCLLSEHLRKNRFVSESHKHNFFMVVLFTKGGGRHEIDFKTYSVGPGNIFFLAPGRTHKFEVSEDAEGSIIFHTGAFFDLQFHAMKVEDYPFYASVYNSPKLEISLAKMKTVLPLFHSIDDEYRHMRLLRGQKVGLDLAALYTVLTRHYITDGQSVQPGEGYVAKYSELQSLVDTRHRELRSPKEFANLLAVSEKHLNLISKKTVNRTVQQLISDRVVLEAKRLLMYSGKTVSQIALYLGFEDVSYFSRFFKRNAGITARDFMRDNRG